MPGRWDMAAWGGDAEGSRQLRSAFRELRDEEGFAGALI